MSAALPLPRVPSEEDLATDWTQRSELVIAWIGWVLLPAGALLAMLMSEASARDRLVTLAIAAGAGVWMLVAFSRPPRAVRDHPLRMPVYLVGFLALAWLLMAREPGFFVFAITGLIHGILLPGGWVAWITGIGASSWLVNTVPGTGDPFRPADPLLAVALTVVQTGSIVGFSYAGTRMAAQSKDRQETVQALRDALDDNASLHAQLLEQAREVGVRDERERMAREIHDTLAQSLVGIITQLDAAGDVEDDVARRHRETATAMAREALTEARRSVDALRPAALADAGLVEALGDLTATWSGRTGVPAAVVTTGDVVPLHPEVAGTLVRVAQEALANVAKHASAGRVGLTLSFADDVVVLDVRDDGVGFDPEDVPLRTEGDGSSGGFGLVAMRQRVERLAGELVVESAPGDGTAVSVVLPAVEVPRA